MARFEMKGMDLMQALEGLDGAEIADAALRAATPIYQKTIIRYAGKHQRTGAMVRSIEASEPKSNKYGRYVVIRPRHKDAKGVRNAEKLGYLEYGTAKQAATPVMKPATADAEQPCLRAMEAEVDRILRRTE